MARWKRVLFNGAFPENPWEPGIGNSDMGSHLTNWEEEKGEGGNVEGTDGGDYILTRRNRGTGKGGEVWGE